MNGDRFAVVMTAVCVVAALALVGWFVYAAGPAGPGGP